MPLYHRYAEDLTGENPDNYVSGELYTLSQRPIRACVPKYGPFYVSERFTVYDQATSRKLEKDIDYAIPVYSQELCLRTGVSVAEAFLITNPQVSDKLIVSYQNVGGPYQNNIENLVNIFETYLADNRSVDWVTGVFGKQTEYPPSIHNHFLSEIYHFEPIVYQLERIAQAIAIGQSPAMDALFQSLMNRIVTSQEIQAGKPTGKLITQERLLEAMKTYNFNSLTLTPSATRFEEGSLFTVDVASTNLDDETVLFWSIEHLNSNTSDFVLNSGVFSILGNKGQFTVQIANNPIIENNEQFRVAVRLNGPTGPIMAQTSKLTIKAHDITLDETLRRVYRSSGFFSPAVPKTARGLYIWRSKAHASHN